MSSRANNNDNEKYRARRNGREGRSRSRSPRGRTCDSGAGDRYAEGVNRRYREEASSSGILKRTRWDVGDPDRGRKQSRAASRSRKPPAITEHRHGCDYSPSGRHDGKFKHRSSRRRSRSFSSYRSRSSSRSSSESTDSDSSESTYRRSRHNRKHHRHRRTSSSEPRSRSRSRERSSRHRKSRDKDGKKKRSRHKERSGRDKRKRSRSPDGRRSVLTGKKIKMKVRKTADDHERDAKREKLLSFLNSAFD